MKNSLCKKGERVFLYRILQILTITTLFLPAFFIPGGVKAANFIIFSIIMFFANLLFYKKFIFDIRDLYRNTPFKYLVYFIIWTAISGFLLVLTGIYPLKFYLFYFVWSVLIIFTLTYLCPFLVFKSNIKTLMKVVIIANFVTYIIGFIQFIGSELSVTAINSFIQIINNARTSLAESRMCGVFEESGFFGLFIFLNLPLLVEIFKTRYRIFKNKIINFVMKKITLPLALACSILLKSPIWLVFIWLFLGYLLLKNISKKNFLKIVVVVVLSVFAFRALLLNTELLERSIYRIDMVKQSITSLDMLVMAEASLGNRIISYLAHFKLFLSHWFLGVGLGNAKFLAIKVFLSNILPLTNEMRINLLVADSKGLNINGAILWSFLAETGIVGAILFYTFVVKTIIMLKKLRRYLTGIVALYDDILITTLIALILLSWYDMNYARLQVWFYIGISLSIYLYVRNVILKGKK